MLVQSYLNKDKALAHSAASFLTLFPMGGGHCVSRQFEIDSIQAGMKF